MNQSQLKYAKERAEGIYTRAMERLRQKHTVKAFSLSNEEKQEALEHGHFKVDHTRKAYPWYNAVVFFAETTGSFNQLAWEAESKVLWVDYHKLLDELVLGDNQEALKLLQAFEASNG